MKPQTYNLSDWVDTISAQKVVILSKNEDLSRRPILHGEDYYTNSLFEEFVRRGIHVDLCWFNGNSLQVHGGSKKRTNEVIDWGTVVILHGVSPLKIYREKLRGKIKVILPMPFLFNRVRSLSDNLRAIIGVFLLQPLIDEYLTSSSSTAEKLRKLGVLRKLSILPPSYSCPFCTREKYVQKRKCLEQSLPSVTNVVYIGSLIPKRISVDRILSLLSQDLVRQYKLTIYTFSEVNERAYRSKNVEVRIIHRRLVEKEKCEILSAADVFISPAKNTSMNPPLSVIEAEYHGNLIKSIE